MLREILHADLRSDMKFPAGQLNPSDGRVFNHEVHRAHK